MHEVLIVITSALPAMLTIIYTTIGLRHKADQDYVVRLEGRVSAAEVALEKCERERDELAKRVRKLEQKKA